MLNFNCDTVQFFTLIIFKTNERILAAGRLDVFDLDLVNLARARSGLLGLGGIRREARHEGFQLGNLFLGFGIVRRLLLTRLG